MLNAQTLGAVALDTIGINGLDTETAATALDNTWFTQADNITYTSGGKVAFRKGLKQGTLDAGGAIGSLVEYKNASSTTLFASYGGNIAKLELTERDDAFKDIYSPADVVTPDWQWSNFNNKLIGVQDNSIRPILYDGDEWNYLEDIVDTSATGNEVNSGSFTIGTRYEISALGTNGDWSSAGGSASASIGDCFTATSNGSGINGSGKAYEGGTFPEGVSNFKPTSILGYFGRLWVGGIEGEKDIIHYSALLDESQWWAASSTTDAGYIDLKTVWGKDEIVAIESFGGKLVIFGKYNIAIYNNPDNLALMALDEVIRGIGCVSLNSVQAVADDLFFLSDTGLRSLTRTATFDKLPLKSLSPTIKGELIANIKGATPGSIKSVYMEDEGLYLLSFSDETITYVFDLTYTAVKEAPVLTESPRVTKWIWTGDRRPSSFVYSEHYGLLVGQKSGRVATYTGYWDSDYLGSANYSEEAYKGSISTVWVDLGQGVQASILKRLLLVVAGGQATTLSLRLFKDFSTLPSFSSSFSANSLLTGTSYKWSNALTQDNIRAAVKSIAIQVGNHIVGLDGDSVLESLITSTVTVGGNTYARADSDNSGTLNISDMIDALQYSAGLTAPGDATYDWIQEHLVDYMLADLDTYGSYFGGSPAEDTSIYGCDTSYDYGDTGFCSNGVYADTGISLLDYRTSGDCTTAGYVWNETTDTLVIDQPTNCSASPSKFAPIAGFMERSIPLSGTAKYLKIEMEGTTNGYETSLQSISLLYKQGKIL